MDKLLASEALYGFAAWLTSREKPVTLSAHHEAGQAAELVGEFCKANGLQEPRDNWTEFLSFPEGSPTPDAADSGYGLPPAGDPAEITSPFTDDNT